MLTKTTCDPVAIALQLLRPHWTISAGLVFQHVDVLRRGGAMKGVPYCDTGQYVIRDGRRDTGSGSPAFTSSSVRTIGADTAIYVGSIIYTIPFHLRPLACIRHITQPWRARHAADEQLLLCLLLCTYFFLQQELASSGISSTLPDSLE